MPVARVLLAGARRLCRALRIRPLEKLIGPDAGTCVAVTRSVTTALGSENGDQTELKVKQ